MTNPYEEMRARWAREDRRELRRLLVLLGACLAVIVGCFVVLALLGATWDQVGCLVLIGIGALLFGLLAGSRR